MTDISEMIRNPPVAKYPDQPDQDVKAAATNGAPLPFKRYPLQESLLPQAVPRDFSDHIYKALPRIAPLEVRIWRAPNPDPHSPWILWIHGGAWCTGSHYAPPSWVIPGFQSKGFHVVTASYRLAPHAKIDDIIRDCIDAAGWCRKNLPDILGPNRINISNMAIGGDSAGGHLSSLLSCLLVPQPKCLVDVYGAVNLTNYNRKDADGIWDERWGHKYSEEQNRAYLKNLNPADTLLHCPFGWEYTNMPQEVTASRWGVKEFSYNDRIEFHVQLKDWHSSRGLMMKNYLGEGDELKEISPFLRVDDCETFPATAFLHGTADRIPIGQPREFAKKLRKKGITVLESYEEGAPHAFDQLYTVSLVQHLTS